MSALALLVILGGVCLVLAVGGWLVERKHKPLDRYETRWPRTRGFIG